MMYKMEGDEMEKGEIKKRDIKVFSVDSVMNISTSPLISDDEEAITPRKELSLREEQGLSLMEENRQKKEIRNINQIYECEECKQRFTAKALKEHLTYSKCSEISFNRNVTNGQTTTQNIHTNINSRHSHAHSKDYWYKSRIRALEKDVSFLKAQNTKIISLIFALMNEQPNTDAMNALSQHTLSIPNSTNYEYTLNNPH